jgi:pimeloyl-ACP methyl ester carboxylesterase
MPLIHYVVAGTGTLPLVFVHGFACDHTDWNAQVAHFSSRHRVVTVDLRGHGASPGMADECSIERYGADVAEVLRGLKLPPAVLIGHSMGCRVVIETALQAPGRTAALVLIDGSQFAAGMRSVLQDVFAAPDGFANLARRWFTEMFTAKSDTAVAASTVERAVRLPRAIGEKVILDLLRYDVGRLTTSLSELRVPVMAIQTTFSNARRERRPLAKDQTTPYLELLRAHVPGVHIEIIPDAGHFPQLDQPEQTNALIENFIAALT